MSGKKKHRGRKKLVPVRKLILIDTLALVCCLLIFALFHHVLPRTEEPVGLVSSREAMVAMLPTEAPTAEPTLAPTPAPTPARVVEALVDDEPLPSPTPAPTEAPKDPVGVFALRYPDKFTDGHVYLDETSYQSANMNITFTRNELDDVVYYVADIYIRDISCLVSGFANDSFGSGITELVKPMAARMRAIMAINGDYYGAHPGGVVIRNSKLYRRDDSHSMDVCAIYWDGTMKVFRAGTFKANNEIAAGCYQAWSFGPSLLDSDGMPIKHFNSDIYRENPRTAIGYFEPGHYCFVVVDGRNQQSEGMNLPDLSMLMYDLGCTVAYNLDGGRTSQMVALNRVVNQPVNGGRPCSDVIALVEPQS